MKADTVLEVIAPAENDLFLFLLMDKAPFTRTAFHAAKGTPLQITMAPGQYTLIAYVDGHADPLALPFTLHVTPTDAAVVQASTGPVASDTAVVNSEATNIRVSDLSGSELSLSFKVDGRGEFHIDFKTGGKGLNGSAVNRHTAALSGDSGGGGEAPPGDSGGGGELVASASADEVSLRLHFVQSSDAATEQPGNWDILDGAGSPAAETIRMTTSETMTVTAPPESDLYLCFLNSENQPFGQNAVRIEAGTTMEIKQPRRGTFRYIGYLSRVHELAHAGGTTLTLEVTGSRR